jgi:hypothetical protein
VLEIVCATRTLKYRDIIYLTTCITLHSDYLARLQGAHCLLLLQFAVTCHVCVLVWCVAVNMVLLTMLKNALEMFYFCSQTHIASEKHAVHCMLKLSFWKWRHYIQNAFFKVIFNARLTTVHFILLIHHKYNLHGFRSDECGGQNPLLVILSPRTLSQQCIWIVCIVRCYTVLLKQSIGSPVTGQVFIVTDNAS